MSVITAGAAFTAVPGRPLLTGAAVVLAIGVGHLVRLLKLYSMALPEAANVNP